MNWPWSKPEKRVSSLTDEIVARILSRSGGDTQAAPTQTAALESAAGLISRAFLSATVIGPENRIANITPPCLAMIARALIREGEIVLALEVDNGTVRLWPCADFDVFGYHDPSGWTYRVNLSGPSRVTTSYLSSASICHFMYSRDPERPWRGQGPINGSGRITGRLHAELETALSDEAAGTRGHLLPIPVDPAAPEDEDQTDPLAGLKATIAGLRGRLAVLETSQGAWGGDRADKPKNDFKPQRLGADPPDVLASLRMDSAMSILTACGCPAALFDSKAPGTTLREGFRQFWTSTLKPISMIIAHELSLKLDADISINFDLPAYIDMVGRASVVSKLSQLDGLANDQILALAGLTDSDLDGLS